MTRSFGPQFIEANNQPYEFSWRWGIENDPGHQGYHGLKEEVHDEFLAVGNARIGAALSPNVVSYKGDGGMFTTAVIAPRDMTAYALTGPLKPSKVLLNGEVVSGSSLQLKAGANALVLEYDKPGRTYFVASTASDVPAAPANSLATRWYNNANVLPFDVRAAEKTPIGWYRFAAPPGLRAMTVDARGKVQAWADGKELKVSGNQVVVPVPPVSVMLRIEQERGFYGGAALPEPIKLDCGPGQIALGDWSKNEGLLSYSGGAFYRKTIAIASAKQVVLDLGDVVASAEVRVNDQPAGVRVSPPWRFDITSLVKPGENRIEILVRNTLANHYTTIPTQYRGKTTSGLLGPVTLNLQKDK